MLWFMMDTGNKPIFMEDNITGALYQVLDDIYDRSKDPSRSSANIDIEEE